ncbi:MAG: sugar nucleotide-binding protein [Azospirillum sp.]|nr:sugar nucleotide-binding protein [Azospirillum sp.]
MRLIVVGATGTIGAPVVRLAREMAITTIAGARRAGAGVATYDLENQPISALVPDLGPEDVVILLAAVSSPGACFADPERAWRINVHCTAVRLAEIERTGASAILMSTDQVFDGVHGGYTEDSTPNPLNLYGRTKAEGERILLAMPQRFRLARTGWNVGWDSSDRCPVRQCYATLLKPGARMAHDNAINVTDVDDTARALISIASAKPSARIHHLVADGHVWRAEMAGAIVSRSARGARMSFVPIRFAELAYPEPRPRLAWLRATRTPVPGFRFASSGDTIARKVRLLDCDRQFDAAIPQDSSSGHRICGPSG